MKLIDLTGKRFCRLVVVCRNEHNDKFNQVTWKCRCDCGNEVIVKGNALKSGNTKSCGCYKLEQIRKSETKHSIHGLKHTRMYNIWHGMKARCYNPNNKDYCNYGARGIVMCDEWKNDFQAFYDWAMANGYSDNLTIDRINNDRNYEPSNCEWVTTHKQNQNKRNNIYLTFNGKTQLLSRWAEETGISVGVLSRRIINGWSVEDALTIKPIIGKNNH